MFARVRRSAALPLTWTADGRVLNGSPTRSFIGSGDWYVEDRLAGDTGDGSLSDLIPGAVTVQNVSGANVLRIRAQAQTTTRGLAASPPRTHTSGELQLSSLAFTGMTLEYRVWFGPVGGCTCAVWLLGANCQQTLKTTEDNTGICQWPNAGSREIDCAEILTGDATHVNCQIHTDVSSAQNLYSPGVDVTAGWHTYKTIWTPGVSVVSFFDGSPAGSDIVTGNVPNEPMFPIINYWPGARGSTITATMPADMMIDYVSVTP